MKRHPRKTRSVEKVVGQVIDAHRQAPVQPDWLQALEADVARRCAAKTLAAYLERGRPG